MIASNSLGLGLFAALAVGLGAMAMPSRREPSEGSTTTVTWRGNEYEVGYDPESAKALFADPNRPAGWIPALSQNDFAELMGVAAADNTTFPSYFVGTEPTGSGSGPEQRRDVVDSWRNTNNEFPYRSIGRFTWGNGIVCSGSLVGSRLVLTAQHCIPEDSQAISFTPFMNDGNDWAFGTYWPTHYYYESRGSDDCNMKGDWAIVVLAEPAGDRLGYLGARTPADDMLNWNWLNTCGYPVAKDNAANMYCHDTATMDRYGTCGGDGPLWTNAAVTGGQSGSSLWARYGYTPFHAFGVASVAYFLDGQHVGSGWASGAEMANAVGRLREEFP